jgi:monoamine oxidase
VVEARNRVGGRVWTLRDGFAAGQLAEAGADLIEDQQEHVLQLARELGLKPERILRESFGFYGPGPRGRRKIHDSPAVLLAVGKLLAPAVRDFKLAGERWDSAIAAKYGRLSVARWLERVNAPATLRAGLRGMRGFFLADPEDLSMLPMLEQYAASGAPGDENIYRIPGGNDRLATAIAKRLKGAVLLGTIVRRVVQHDERVTVTIQALGEPHTELTADFFVCALPASTARGVLFEPSLPEPQHDAIAHLRYGGATRLLLQFDRRFWVKRGRPKAFGTDLPIGSVWDGNEHQRGPKGILSFLAGGNASKQLQDILHAEGTDGVLPHLGWLGKPATVVASHIVAWDHDPWARGGYAYFDTGFDPLWREWLARPAGRLVFAGEHTSVNSQGYMNGAVESGLRAAAEISAIALD